MSPFHNFSKGRRFVKSMEASGGMPNEVRRPFEVDCELTTAAAAIENKSPFKNRTKNN